MDLRSREIARLGHGPTIGKSPAPGQTPTTPRTKKEWDDFTTRLALMPVGRVLFLRGCCGVVGRTGRLDMGRCSQRPRRRQRPDGHSAGPEKEIGAKYMGVVFSDLAFCSASARWISLWTINQSELDSEIQSLTLCDRCNDRCRKKRMGGVSVTTSVYAAIIVFVSGPSFVLVLVLVLF